MAENVLRIGSPSPGFEALPGTDGKRYSLSDFSKKKVLVVVFSCNHCPYVQAYEDRMIDFQRDYASKDVQLVAINSNETVHYLEDNFDEMVKRAKKRGFNFPYLPEFFVLDQQRALRYHGKMDDNHQSPSDVKVHYLRDAVDALLAGKDVKQPETYSIGCTIKWR